MTTTVDQARQMLAGRTIWLWHYLHADWQWEQSRAWHEDRYALAVSEVLDLMQHDPEITYFFDTASEFFEPVARKLAPRLEELYERIRSGRIRIVSAQVANARPNQVGDETYLRNLQIGREFFTSRFPDIDLSLFHSVDIAIGHTQMPQILNLAGFRYYRAWRPHGPMNALGIPHQFIWQGLDGARILVTRGQYSGMYMNKHVPFDYAENWDSAVTTFFDDMFHDQLLHDRSPSQQLWMIQGSDDARPLRTWEGDRPIDLPGMLALWREREATPINWCTPLEFSQAVAAASDQLTVVRGMLDNCDCSYNVSTGGSNGLWVWRQMNDRRLLRAEWWSAAAASAGFLAPHAELHGLWRQHLTYQAHAEEFAFREDLDELIDMGQEVRLRTARIEGAALKSIAAAAGGGDRMTQYVFNPHPWQLETDIELYHPIAVTEIESLDVLGADGQPLPHQLLSELRHPRYAGSVNDQHQLVRLTLPPMGYQRIQFVEQTTPPPARPAAPEQDVLETRDLRLVYRDHALRSVEDLHNGKQYAGNNGAPWPGLTFHALDHQNWLFTGAELERQTFAPTQSQWIETGPLRWRHRSSGTLGPLLATVDTLVADQGRELRVQVRLEGHWERPPVTGFVTLLADIDTGGALHADVPFGVETRDPDHDIYVNNLPQDREIGLDNMFERLRPGYFWARSWVDWSGDGCGLLFASADGNHYWFKEPGQVGHVALRVMELVPNSWEERCANTMTGAGVHNFAYTLRLHDGNWQQVEPQRRAAEGRHPPRAIRPDAPTPAILPAAHSFLSLSDSALLSAYYREGDDYIARIYDAFGAGGPARLTLDWAPSTVEAIDLLGQPVEVQTAISGQEVTVQLQPWQIVTLRLKRA